VDIVCRAYTQAKEDLEKTHPNGTATVTELHTQMVKHMVRWIMNRAYRRLDWPSRQFGPYPKELEAEVKNW
jgi:3-methyladenine DNA glycosylase AlkC